MTSPPQSMEADSMLRRTVLATGVALGLTLPWATPGLAADTYVDASEKFIRDLADEAIATLSDPTLDKDARRDKFRELFTRAFAVKGIGIYVLGRYRKRATKEELTEYLQLFEDVTVNTWADRFTEYGGQKFEVNGAVATPSPRETEKAAIVQSTFYTAPDSPVAIEWRVASNGTVYKIVDIKVSGLSLAKTQQDEYGQVIRSGGNKISVLIDKLRELRDS